VAIVKVKEPEVVIHVYGGGFLGDSRWNHPGRARCPGVECGLILEAVALQHLAYVFETCQCGTPEYPHLIEQLWHRDCLVDS
jgi:hypothetical protein